MPDETATVRGLGWTVFTPRVLPHGLDARSTSLEDAPDDAALQLPSSVLELLRNYPFYDRQWSPTLKSIVNKHFDVMVTSFYHAPYASSVRHFKGTLIARAFGREGDNTYNGLLSAWEDDGLVAATLNMGHRFVFGQAYAWLAEVEPPLFAQRAVTLPVPLPGWIKPAENAWTGIAPHALFFCPIITGSAYYKLIYDRIKTNFGGLPHIIFGKQAGHVEDPCVLPGLDDNSLRDLYVRSRVFVYPADEPRHLHYAPLEAMLVGVPVLYLRGALLDRVAGLELPGACKDLSEMCTKARSMLGGEVCLANSIRAAQKHVLRRFSNEAVRCAWRHILERAPLRTS